MFHCFLEGFVCDNQTKCLSPDQVCDGQIDCDDGLDELGLQCPDSWCLHHCNDSKHCLAEEQICDGNNDCTDASDELFCKVIKENS